MTSRQTTIGSKSAGVKVTFNSPEMKRISASTSAARIKPDSDLLLPRVRTILGIVLTKGQPNCEIYHICVVYEDRTAHSTVDFYNCNKGVGGGNHIPKPQHAFHACLEQIYMHTIIGVKVFLSKNILKENRVFSFKMR